MFALKINRWLYANIAKPIFFKIDPESVHDCITRLGETLGRFSFTKRVVRFFFDFEHPMLAQQILGINFKNPIGVTAGFDKNAHLTDIMRDVGFGFEEIGTVTGQACAGNPKPRLWRLPKSKGLVVWYGFKNDGCEAIVARLRGKKFEIPIGTSVAQTNSLSITSIEDAITDFAKAFRAFDKLGDYTVINISCPNTGCGQTFSNPELLDRLFTQLDKIETDKPIFLKLSADTSIDELNRFVKITNRHRVHGFIFCNLTKRHDRPEIDQNEIAGINNGGISGRPISELSNQLISHLYKTAGHRYIIIGSGGIFCAKNAYEKIRLGASLVELATGMIFEGPQLIGEINRGLIQLLKQDGFYNISSAIGCAHKNKL